MQWRIPDKTLEQRKDISGKTGNWIKSVVCWLWWITVNFFALFILLWLCEVLTKGKLSKNYIWKLQCLCKSLINLTLYQNYMFKKHMNIQYIKYRENGNYIFYYHTNQTFDCWFAVDLICYFHFSVFISFSL